MVMSYEDLSNMDDEIQHHRNLVLDGHNPYAGIKYSDLYPILAKYIPEFKKFLENGTDSTNNPSRVASTSPTTF